MIVIYYIIYCCLVFTAVLAQEETTDSRIENEKNCRDRNRLITTDKGDIYMLVDSIIGEKLILQCHYCKENDDQQPKMWYRIKILGKSSPEEVHLGMHSNSSLNRVLMNMQHSLIFRNTTVNDTGFYYCIGLEGQESDNKYSYFIDIVPKNETKPEQGNLTDWRRYHNENFMPINKQFASSPSTDYVYLREELHLNVEVITEWEPWGPCEVCGRPQGAGKRRKKGFCRLKITPSENNSKVPQNDDELIIVHASLLSCRSLIIQRLFPTISQITQLLPHFVQVEHCEGICNPDAEGLSKGWKAGKNYKYKKSFVLAQDAHLTLVCPESTLQNVVIWRRNGKILKRGVSVQSSEPNSEPKITVDTFNTLYLHGVTKEEEGNYTCQVDNIRMQQVKVFVVSKSKLLTQAFVRHMMYLAFVLSLTLTCYCAGLFVTWTRRHKFMGYEELLESRTLSEKSSDEEEEDVV